MSEIGNRIVEFIMPVLRVYTHVEEESWDTVTHYMSIIRSRFEALKEIYGKASKYESYVKACEDAVEAKAKKGCLEAFLDLYGAITTDLRL